MPTPALAPFESAVLLSVVRLGDDAYGLAVRRDVSKRIAHDYSVGAIYTTLQRLEDKGLVRTWTSEPLPVRGGRARKHFRVTSAGKRALREAERRATAVWAGIPTLQPSRP